MSGLTRTSLLARPGVLAVVRGRDGDDAESQEPFVIVGADGAVMAFNGHVDLGTGVRTALAQIVAEELDVPLSQVTMILGDTTLTPDQGATIASETIQIAALPLRRAAAQARRELVARAAHRLGVAAEAIVVDDGFAQAGGERIGYGELVGNATTWLTLDETTPVKPVAAYRLVGASAPRVDLPAKAAGSLVYVYDMRLPGMLHGRVVRPPYAGVDSGSFVGRSLISVDRASVAHIPGLVAVVSEGDFVGVVAEREEQAEAAMRALKLEWRPTPRLPDLKDLAGALSAHPSTPRVLMDRGDVDAELSRAAKRLTRRYTWPYQMHASLGPSCALADASEGGLCVWSGTQNPHRLRDDLALLTGLPQSAVIVIRMEAAGCYGRNGADDVSADAALLARAVGKPVRVQLSREQEHLWEPKGAAQLVDVDGGLDAAGEVSAYRLDTRYPSNLATTLALLLTGRVSNAPEVAEMGDRTAIGPYEFDNKRIVCHDMAPIVRASWFRGVSALPNTFAHESWIDEAASEAGADPIEYRLRYLQDPRGRELIKTLAAKVGWDTGAAPHKRRDEHGRLIGRGFAYALYVHSKFPGYGAAWAAWVADVAVDTNTGEVTLSRVSVAQDSGLMINPAGVRHQIHGNVVQSTSRVLKEEVTFTDVAVQSREWGGYPLLTFPELPAIDVTLMPPPDDEALGVGESASVPSAAAIANAIFDATGVRFREPPFTPDRVLRGLREAGVAAPPAALAPPPAPARAGFWAQLKPIAYAAAGAVASLAIFASPWRAALEPVARPDAALYSQATRDKGRALAELGGCVHCHTGEGGERLAGGRLIETPYGRLWSTNLTPDVETGIGGWSLEAFRRALREGVSRDGHRLYPAFPFTAFAKASDEDVTAIYAYLMAAPAVALRSRAPELRFPYSLRPLNAIWSALYHDARPFKMDTSQSAPWNRGAYLVEGIGHCSACHSPRDALGGEISGARFRGGFVGGWEAPALVGALVPWSEGDLFDYLRTGFSSRHGAAGGSMAPIVVALQAFPDADLKAIAHYLVSFAPTTQDAAEAAAAQREARAASAANLAREQNPAGARLYEGACAACHEPGPPTFGVRPSLAVASALASDRPDNLIRAILEGARSPLSRDLGAMPAFAGAFDDEQIHALARYLRARFASEAAPWPELAEHTARLRASLTPGGY